MGSSTSGVSSGLQASRLGAKTCMIEESSWGPMTTYVGSMISAFDGPLQNYPNYNAACNNVFCASTGIFSEIERAIHTHPNYCPDVYPCTNLSKGSVSVSAFEPEVARTVLNSMLNASDVEPKLSIYYGMSVATVLLNTSGSKPRVIGVTATNSTGTHTFYANVTVDATELGEVVALAGVGNRIGRETNATTGEPHALGGPENIECSGPTCVADNKTQAFNIAFVIKDYGTGTSATKPTDYDANKYKYAASYGDFGLPWGNYIGYGYTPNSDYNGTDRFNYKKNFQNWPNYGNDFAFHNETFKPCSNKSSIVEMSKSERDCLLAKARSHSLNFFYFLKTEPYCSGWLNCSKATTQAMCGSTGYLCWWNGTACERNTTIGASCAMITDQARCNGNNTVNCSWAPNISEASNWGIFDVFGAPDKLAAIPYYRESRHIIGLYQLKEQDISQATNPGGRGKHFNDSIAIGDFSMDVHAAKAHPNKNNSFNNDSLGHLNIPTYPFQIPYGVLIPNNTDGLIVAEKSISVTHIANGATRLQPVVTLIGQAAGAAAAISAQKGIQPRNLDVRELQKVLLDQSTPEMLFFFSDLPINHPRFRAIEVLALDQVAQGYGPPDYAFKPDQNVTRLEAGLFVRRALQLDTSWWWNYSNTSRWVANVTDINDTDNYSKAYYLPFWKDVQALYANNITKGCEMVNETTIPVKIKFCPNRPITRSEIIVFVTRSRKLIDYNKTTQTFADVNNTYWSYREIEAAYADYIIDSTDYNSTWHLRPSENATRADVVNWLYRGVKRFNTAPTHRRVNITSTANLTCITDSLNDVDYDNISATYKWIRNGASRAKLLMPFDVDEKDYSDSNNNVIINGPVAFRRRGELKGGRMDFNGVNTSINVSDSNYLDLPKNLTVEAWVLKRNNTFYAGIVSKAHPGYYDGYNYNLRENSTNGKISFHVGNGTTIFNVTTTDPLEFNKWYHIVGIRTGTTLALYVNGKLNNSVSITSSDLSTGNYPVMIGAAYGFPRYFNGSIDEVRIYDYALSPAQIEMHSKRLYNMTAQQETRNGETWKCEVMPNDGYHNGAALNSSTVTITNGFSGSGFGGEGSFGAGNEEYYYGEILE